MGKRTEEGSWIFFAVGKRSNVYKKKIGEKWYVKKVAKEGIGIKGHIENEIHFLRILNKKGIGPSLYKAGKEWFICDFIPGERILDYLEKTKEQRKIFVKVLEQCFIIDRLGINKEEMHNPYKHIIIKKRKVTMIDFERCRWTEKPKNVTQFFQFLFMLKVLDRADKDVQTALKRYKETCSKENFKQLIIIVKKQGLPARVRNK